MVVLFLSMAFLAAYSFIPCFDPFGTVLCRGPVDKPWIALTFDDGPNEPYTSQILDILQHFEVPATFFVVGQHAQEFPQSIKKIHQMGYAIGNHTFDHHPLVFKSRQEQDAQITDWEKVMTPLNILPSFFFRAPHGWKNPFLHSVLHGRGYHLIGWTFGVWDSDRPGKEVLLSRLRKGLKNGAIILLHDGDGDQPAADRSQTVALLPELIELCRSLGYQFVSLDQMMGRETLPVED